MMNTKQNAVMGEGEVSRVEAKRLLKRERDAKNPNQELIGRLYKLLNERECVADNSFSGSHWRYKLK